MPWVEKRTRSAQYKSSCKEQASSDKNLSVKPYSLINQSFNCPFKLDIVLKLAHQLGPIEQTTNSCTLNHPILEPRVVNTRAWRHYPNMGSYVHPNTVKKGNFRGLPRIWEFFSCIARRYNSAAESTSLLSYVASLAMKSNHWFIVPFAVGRLNCRIPYKLWYIY